VAAPAGPASPNSSREPAEPAAMTTPARRDLAHFWEFK
jgi:hypothetical protein